MPGAGGSPEGGRRFGGGGPGGGGMMAGLSEEDGKKLRAAMTKALAGKSMRDLTPEERAKVMQEAAKAVPAAAKMMQAGGRPGGMPGGPGGPGAAPGGYGQFSAQDLQNARLPATAGPDSQLDVLLRPGLLADVEIILEKFSDAIHVPNQAVFEKDGKQIVYVRANKGWEERVIQPAKRSESVMVIANGIKPGDVIAMSDPFAKPGDKKKGKPASASPVGGMPGGGRS